VQFNIRNVGVPAGKFFALRQIRRWLASGYLRVGALRRPGTLRAAEFAVEIAQEQRTCGTHA